jgi:hypothetical protein
VSYGFQLYSPDVRNKTAQGLEMDEFTHPHLDKGAVERFVSKLIEYGYEPESTTPRCREFVKHVGRCPVQVAVFVSEIAFSIPYRPGSQEAIFEALQDASELIDGENMAMFNRQDGEWREV